MSAWQAVTSATCVAPALLSATRHARDKSQWHTGLDIEQLYSLSHVLLMFRYDLHGVVVEEQNELALSTISRLLWLTICDRTKVKSAQLYLTLGNHNE